MPNLSDRLKALGVQIGADKTPVPVRKVPIEQVLEGRILDTPYGEAFVVEEFFATGHNHGSHPLLLDAPTGLLADWAGQPEIANCTHSQYAFLDTETTGLAGGSGTLAFMVGVGRFEEEGFRLWQFFLRDPAEEPSMLAALEEFIAPCATIVSFNGKSFDIPLLDARYITNAAPTPFKQMAHLDLLHISRRLWSSRLPSRALGYLEEHIIGETRTEEDTPGWMIPQMYFDYLQSGDARPMKGIFYHNQMDILSMAVLMNHIAAMLSDPMGDTVEHALDLVAIGRLHEDLGNEEQAITLYTACLAQELPFDALSDTRQRLAWLYRRREDWPQALSLWWQAAADREVYAHEELAKYFEHQDKNYTEALKWTQAALALLKKGGIPRVEQLRWEPELKHRLERLKEREQNQKTNL